MTIDELVQAIKPDYVSIDNPAVRGEGTPGTAVVSSVKIEYDKVDGVMMYIRIA